MEVNIRYSHTFLGRTGGFSRHCAGYLVPKTSTSNSPLLTKFWSGNRKEIGIREDAWHILQILIILTYVNWLSIFSTEVLDKTETDLFSQRKSIACCRNLFSSFRGSLLASNLGICVLYNMARRKQLTVPQNSSFLKIDSPPQGQGSRSELCSTGSSRSITKSFFTPCSICEEKLRPLFLDKSGNLSL